MKKLRTVMFICFVLSATFLLSACNANAPPANIGNSREPRLNCVYRRTYSGVHPHNNRAASIQAREWDAVLRNVFIGMNGNIVLTADGTARYTHISGRGSNTRIEVAWGTGIIRAQATGNDRFVIHGVTYRR